MKYPKAEVVQIENKLIILNGVDPLRYVDLATNKVHVYPGKGYPYDVNYLLKKQKPINKFPTPTDILKAAAKLQKAGADLSKMVIVHDQADMNKFWIVNKKDLKRNQK